MSTGTVKWFKAHLGYGFVIQDSDRREVFVHWTVIDQGRPGFKTLHEDQYVEYEAVDGPRGLIASSVHTAPVDHSSRYLQEAPCNTL